MQRVKQKVIAMQTKNQKDLLSEYQKIDLLLTEKSKEYGDFLDIARYVMNFYEINMRANKCINVFEKHKQDTAKLSIIMLGLKLARLNIQSDNKDTLQDFLGYLRLFNKNVGYEVKLMPAKNSNYQQRELVKIANRIIKDCNKHKFFNFFDTLMQKKSDLWKIISYTRQRTKRAGECGCVAKKYNTIYNL